MKGKQIDGELTFCFARRISASLSPSVSSQYQHKVNDTHDSLRFCREAALSFGFFAFAAAFFCALRRSCSRWLPPSVRAMSDTTDELAGTQRTGHGRRLSDSRDVHDAGWVMVRNERKHVRFAPFGDRRMESSSARSFRAPCPLRPWSTVLAALHSSLRAHLILTEWRLDLPLFD